MGREAGTGREAAPSGNANAVLSKRSTTMFAGSTAPARRSLLAASAAGVCGLILLAAGSRQLTPATEPPDAGSPPSSKRTAGDEASPIFVEKIPPDTATGS